MNLKYIKKQLKRVNLNYKFRNSKRILKDLDNLKKQAVKRNDQKVAKGIWCYEQILKIQDIYSEAYDAFKAKKYYDGWRSLEQAEIVYNSLYRHFKEENDEYWLEFINKHINQYQSVFPYGLFFSPEYLKKEVKCSICGKIISIRNPCGHRKGEIYNGEMCTRIITDLKMIGNSLVNSPGQKYSVPFKHDPKTGKMTDHMITPLLNTL
jgi:hypothetical protein